MKVTCGTDIIEVERIKDSIENSEGNFLDRVYTKDEIKYCEGRKVQKYQHYAGRFAAKEAVFKAIAECLEDKYSICWKDIEVLNDKRGKPHVSIQSTECNEIDNIDISISHCKEYAVATVVVVWNV